jgi:hypothetical protein
VFVSLDLVPRFPLFSRGTHLVLADTSGDDLCVFWHLSGDDLVPALAGFARDGARPMPVLRVRRLKDGVAELVQEIPLRLTGPRGGGEQLFPVGPQPARYDAELGLSDAAGGWLMLARSNALDHAARLDVRLPQARRASALSSGIPETTEAESAPAATGSEIARSDRAPSAPEGQAAGPDPGTGAVLSRDRLAMSSAASRAAAPMGLPNEPARHVSAGSGLADAAPRASGSPPELNPPVADRREFQSVRSDGGEERSPGRSAEPRGIGSPTAPMVYGQAVLRNGELLIEAELRINGCAAPGSEIDLFGFSYRVGPGGRFQFFIKVDDPALIKRAFELNPPSLVERPKDDDGDATEIA